MTDFNGNLRRNNIFDRTYLPNIHSIVATLNGLNKSEDRTKEHGINLADFLPEPISLSQVLRIPTHTKEKWGEAIRAEITGLFDSETFSLNEKPLPVCWKHEIISRP